MARRIAICALMVVLVVTLTWAQTKIEKKTAPYTPPNSGKEMFKAYCASCHGVDGKGDGPAASAMKTGVPDITQLAKKSGGKFPSDHISSIISGAEPSAAHGSAEMPVWGPVFLSVSGHQAGQVQLRIHNLVGYIETLQVK